MGRAQAGAGDSVGVARTVQPLRSCMWVEGANSGIRAALVGKMRGGRSKTAPSVHVGPLEGNAEGQLLDIEVGVGAAVGTRHGR